MNEVWTDEQTQNLAFGNKTHYSLYLLVFHKLLFNKYVCIFWVCFERFSLFKHQPGILFNYLSVLLNSVKWHNGAEDQAAPKISTLVWIWLCVRCKSLCRKSDLTEVQIMGNQVLLIFLGDSRLKKIKWEKARIFCPKPILPLLLPTQPPPPYSLPCSRGSAFRFGSFGFPLWAPSEICNNFHHCPFWMCSFLEKIQEGKGAEQLGPSAVWSSDANEAYKEIKDLQSFFWLLR